MYRNHPPMVRTHNPTAEIIGTLLWLAVLVAVVVVILHVLRNHNAREAGVKVDPIDIAKERYAKGEITKEQFEQLKKDLK